MNQTDLFKKFYITTLTLFAVFLYGCDISDSNKSTVSEELSEEELEVAGQIIAESLSDQKDGIFASLNDAFSLPSNSNLTEGSVEKGKYASPLFSSAMAKNSNSNANNYSYNYDPDTGIHLINFSRSVNEEDFTKESTAELEYIYYDTDGAFIYSPRLDSDLIETIEYSGTRSGSITTPNKISSYERNDEFLIDGLTSGGPLTIEGLHEGSGQFEVTRESGDVIKRDYTLTVEFLDVQINSQTLSDGSLQKSVEGALAYEMMISKNLNGEESMKTVNGTIEFNGDGTALLRFQNILDDFKVTLEQGNLIADNEFEGFIESADTESDPQQFTLSDGNTYLFGTDTEIDSEGDLTTLAEVQTVLESDIRVQAEGTFSENTDGAFIIQNVKFEYEDDDLEFEDTVESVDAEAGTFTLENGDILHITDETNFDEDGDLSSLEDLLWALENEFSVEAEGEFLPGEDESNDVTEVKFEYDDEDFEFDDNVASVDEENSSFSLENDDTYIIDEGTTFHDRSDINSFEELATAISEGTEVEAEGEYTPQSDGSRIVAIVKFETDDNDGDGDDDGNDDEDRTEIDFSGNVESADAAAKTFSLQSGLVIHTNDETEFEDDIQSLGNLVGAIQRGDKVSVEGEYYKDSEDNNIALELEFDVDRRDDEDNDSDDGDDSDDDDEERDEFEFEGDVNSADAGAKTFQVDDVTFYVTNETEFDGDLNSLGNLVGALQRGDTVEAEGEYYTDDEGRNIVTEVEFDAERRDDDDDDSDDDGDDDGDDDSEDDDDREEFDFEGNITSATSTTFTLDGQTFTVNDDTEIEGDDGVNTLDDVIDALNNDDEVGAEGEYYVDGDDNIVIEVEFDVERRDDEDDDDSDDGDDSDDEDSDDDDDDREEFDFEGAVTSATSTTFTLDGQTFTVNDDTEIDGDDGVNTLQDVMDALDDGDEVEAEGEYYVDGSDNIVIEVEFDVERRDDEDDDDSDDGDDDGDDGSDDDDDREEFDFEGNITSATSTTFTLDGQTFTVNDDTEIDGDDGVNTLDDVIDALNNDDEVGAEGEYYVDGSDNIVIEVEFDVERRDDEDDDDSDDGDDDSDEDGDDDDDREEFDFEGNITSATSTTFTLDGQTFTVNDDTEIEGDNGVNTLQDVMDALNDDAEVEAEGEYYVDGSDNIVIEVEFDVERDEEEDDDEDEDDDDDEEEEEDDD